MGVAKRKVGSQQKQVGGGRGQREKVGHSRNRWGVGGGGQREKVGHSRKTVQWGWRGGSKQREKVGHISKKKIGGGG